MTSSVLGKRIRGPADAAAITSVFRAKRRATTVIYNDENSNLSSTRETRSCARDVSSMELDELANVVPIDSKRVKQSLGSQLNLSPAKIKAHFNTVKSESDENLKPIEFKTPQTPRRRDALSKITPTTPRHRVTILGKILTPRTPRTPRTPSTPGGSLVTVYNAARKLFIRSSDPGRLVGRENERQELKSFISSCIETASGGCTYVSGPPGTGKSALVHEVISEIQETETIKKAYVNCMSMKTSKDVYTTLLDAFHEDLQTVEGEELRTLQDMFAPRKKSATVYLVTLDEIDHVLTLDLEFMYKLFEWSLQMSSRLILVGIANALDLTDRFLPRLKARNLKPRLLPFLPYTAGQIKDVITIRLKSLLPTDFSSGEYVPFIHPAAVELCSRKVSRQTGDLRKAFDICRRAIELIESETREKHQQALNEQALNSPSRKPLGENVNLSSPPIQSPIKNIIAPSLRELTVETAPRATIAHLSKITLSTLGNGTNQRLQTLNLQQKAALCALVAFEKRKCLASSDPTLTPSKSNNAAPTVKVLYDSYYMLCKRDAMLHPLTSTEFRDVIGSLETLSLISAVDGKSGSFVGLNTPSKRGRKPGFGGGVGIGDEKRVRSCVGEREIQEAVDGAGASILTSILSGEGLE